MTDDLRKEILRRHADGDSMNQIAKDLGLWPFSVRYQIRREKYRQRDRSIRRRDGAGEYACSHCHEIGHNVVACPELEKSS